MQQSNEITKFTFYIICDGCKHHRDDTTFENNRCSICRTPQVPTKCCSKCKQIKPITVFEKIGNRCKPCINAQDREREHARNPNYKPKPVASQPDHIICSKCSIEKHKDEFRDKRRTCRDCGRADGRAYRQTERGHQKSKEWYDNNAEKFKRICAKWYQDNKQRIYDRYNERYHTDLNFKIRRVCKDRLAAAIKKNQRSTLDFLGCNIDHLTNWFAFNYDENMNDDNHGTYWHIDHVIPISTFDLNDETQRRICFSWYNLSPLEAKNNMTKNNRIDKQQLFKHMYNLSVFTENNIDKDYLNFCATHLDAGNP